jgi:hypothetical protein
MFNEVCDTRKCLKIALKTMSFCCFKQKFLKFRELLWGERSVVRPPLFGTASIPTIPSSSYAFFELLAACRETPSISATSATLISV